MLNTQKNYALLANILIIVGLLTLAVFLYKLSTNFNVWGNEVLLDESSKVGDFVGGLVGSLWALASVLLFYSALVTQKEDFNSQHKEVVINRLSNIVFLQIDKVKNSINETEIIIDYNYPISGREAFNHLYTSLKEIPDTEESYRNVSEKNPTFRTIMGNNAPILSFLDDFSSAITIIDKILNRTHEIETQDKIDLIYLFSGNFGEKYVSIFKQLQGLAIGYLEKSTKELDKTGLYPLNHHEGVFTNLKSQTTEILDILDKYKESN